MKVRLLLFAALRDVTGQSECSLELPPEVESVGQLLDYLQSSALPALAGRLSTVRVAVNESFVDSQAKLSASDTVALIPPVCGG